MSDAAPIAPDTPADELIPQLGDQTDEALVALLEQEQGLEKPRKTVVSAIQNVQRQRAAAAAEAEASETSFEIDHLLENSRTMTGYSRPLLAGALHGMEGPVTVTEAKQLCKDFAEREVVPDEEGAA
jgi:hypothetical protein